MLIKNIIKNNMNKIKKEKMLLKFLIKDLMKDQMKDIMWRIERIWRATSRSNKEETWKIEEKIK